MRTIFLLICVLSFAGVLFFVSCQKELSCEGCRETNKPPIANAGPDELITLPTDSASLDGTASSDPDGTISEWLWTKISGPASFTIDSGKASRTVVKNLIVGLYQFELKVTDDGGLSARDTVQVVVNDPVQPNRPPVADAGPDQTIILPTNTITLDGSGSTDPENDIKSFAWTRISGPSLFNLANAAAVETQVTNLVVGDYQFELKVTDAGGLFSTDTMRVIVNPQLFLSCDNSNRPLINARLIPIGTLSQARAGMTVASAGNKIVYAGSGLNGIAGVDIYDIATQTWSTAQLSVARYLIAAVAAGDKIFFGGGEISDGTWPVNTVDIYDVSSNTWSVSALSIPGHSISAAAVGNKVFFAGGDGGFTGQGRSGRVDIYDLTTSMWATASLSEARIHSAAVTANNKIYFAGGEAWTNNPGGGNFWFASNRIDIYDNATNSWSTSSLNEGKIFLAGITVADKIYWAGGFTGSYNTSIYTSCTVEIQDVNTGNSSIQNLFGPGLWSNSVGQNAVVKNDKIVFNRAGESDTNRFDIYDITSQTWSIGVLPVHIQSASIISVDNTIYIAGGLINGVVSKQVWILEF